jgi:hypothetical protein
MPMISLLFSNVDGASFNYSYLEQVHLSLMLDRWRHTGLKAIQIYRGLGGPNGDKLIHPVIAMLHFDALDPSSAAIEGGFVEEITAELARFTLKSPTVQINERISEANCW